MRTAERTTVASLLPNWCHAPIFSVAFGKELRVVFPIALLGSAAIPLAFVMPEDIRLLYVLLAYGVSCGAIGSMAAGHDFHYRTLVSTLALPMDRGEVWKNRMLAAVLAMLPVALVATATLFGPPFSRIGFDSPQTRNLFTFGGVFLVAPFLTGLCLAPLLTLLARNALFGTVFALGFPYSIMAAGNFFFSLITAGEVSSMTNLLLMVALPITWGVSGWLGYLKFLRLEAVEGGAVAEWAAQSDSVTPGRRRNAYGQLFWKEIRLQQIPLGITFCAYLFAIALKADQVAVWTLIYSVIAAILFGAVASADERQAGVAEWQILVPISFAKQWSVKVITTLALSGIFAGMIPVGIVLLLGKANDLGPGSFWEIAAVVSGWVMMLSAFSLYISSNCDTGLKAVLISLPVSLGVGILIVRILGSFAEALYRQEYGTAGPSEWWREPHVWPMLLAVGGFVALGLCFAGRNHRYSDRGARRFLTQTVCMAGYFVAGLLLTSLSMLN